MSTKTIYKRIALVAVTALGAGVLSVAPANAASAGTGVVEVTGTMCAANNLTTGALVTNAAVYSNESYGTQITVPLGGSITVEGHDAQIVIVRGSSITSTFPGAGQTATTNTAGETIITFAASSIPAAFSATALGTTTLVAGLAVATAATTTANRINIVVVASCSLATFSSANSLLEIQGTSIAATDGIDTVPVIADGAEGFVSLVAKNALGSVFPSGVWSVTATNGAKVAIVSANPASAAASVASVAFATAGGTDIRTAVVQATAGVSQTTTVTLAYNGVAVGSKSLLFLGQAASIVVSSIETGKTGTINFRTFKTSVLDAAGNRITASPFVVSTTLDQNVTAVAAGATNIAADTQDTNSFTCNTGAKETTNVALAVVASTSGAIITSAPFALKCASTTRTYAASLDKAVYAPGDIATLTITGKDINGSAPFDGHKTATTGSADDTFNLVNGSAAAPTIAGSQMTAVNTPTATDAFAGGVAKYTFIVGSIEGDFQMAVNLTGITTDTAKAVKYSVKASSTTVSNADVLKAIVSLIASINKQIAALQKALLARR
jgi:hypothetical protein